MSSLEGMLGVDETDFFRINPKRRLTPEQTLMLAVLTDAVWTLHSETGAGVKRRAKLGLLREVQAWIDSDDDDWVFSFGSICEVFHIDRWWLRKGIREFVAREDKPKARANTHHIPSTRYAMTQEAELHDGRKKALG